MQFFIHLALDFVEILLTKTISDLVMKMQTILDPSQLIVLLFAIAVHLQMETLIFQEYLHLTQCSYFMVKRLLQLKSHLKLILNISSKRKLLIFKIKVKGAYWFLMLKLERQILKLCKVLWGQVCLLRDLEALDIKELWKMTSQQFLSVLQIWFLKRWQLKTKL